MKELSIEEKAKRYDEALRNAMIYYKNGNGDMKIMMKTCFPVLAEESEDERTWIINYLNNRKLNSSIISEKENLKKAITWLEKQGKNNMGISEATKQKLEDNLNKALEKETPESWNEFLDEQGEQKPTDKVELKFHKGEWLCENEPNNYARFIQILEIVNVQGKERYRVSRDIHNDEDIVEFDFVEKYYHKFNIQDAKDGDVLCCKSGWMCIFKALDNHTNTFSSYCFMDNTKWFCETGSECHTLDKVFIKAYNGEIHPATNEQRDLLFQKMKEAGYEWNADEKKLKKIEEEQVIDYPDNLQKDNWELVHEFVNKFGRIPKDEDELNVLVEYVLKRQNPDWSEEDDQYLLVCKNALAKYQTTDKWDANIISHWLENKLKSLRPQNTWKPSDEQMKVLEWCMPLWAEPKSKTKAIFESLINDLKKLREE